MGASTSSASWRTQLSRWWEGEEAVFVVVVVLRRRSCRGAGACGGKATLINFEEECYLALEWTWVSWVKVDEWVFGCNCGLLEVRQGRRGGRGGGAAEWRCVVVWWTKTAALLAE